MDPCGGREPRRGESNVNGMVFRVHLFHCLAGFLFQVIISVRGSMSQTDIVTDLLCWPVR